MRWQLLEDPPSRAESLLWRLMALPAFAVVVGGIQRLAIQAARVGWLPEGSLEFLLVESQISQSIITAVIGLIMFLGVRRVGRRLADVESVAGAVLDRVTRVDVDSLDLTPRQREVLEVLGGSSLVDNKTLSEKLGVSTETVHTHMSALLRKTKLNDRRDLAVVAYLHRNLSQE